MEARPVLFLIMSLLSSFILNVADRSEDGRRFERRYDTSHLIFNVPGGQLRSMLHCATLCDRSPSCKAFCYSRSTALCHLSQPYDPIVQDYDVSDSKCYNPTGCPMTKGYAWYGARCIKGYADKKIYADAEDICTQDGGHLYHFKALEWDRTPIEDLQMDVGNMGGWLWVGADDLAAEGQYRWSDSALLDNGSPVWRSDCPIAKTKRSCVALGNTFSVLINIWCSRTKKFVCQIDV